MQFFGEVVYGLRRVSITALWYETRRNSEAAGPWQRTFLRIGNRFGFLFPIPYCLLPAFKFCRMCSSSVVFAIIPAAVLAEDTAGFLFCGTRSALANSPTITPAKNPASD